LNPCGNKEQIIHCLVILLGEAKNPPRMELDMRHALLTTAAVLTTKPQQRWWQSTNRTIIAFGLLLCVVLGVGGAYLLGLLELVSVLH
jgi:hypothetical protein